MSRSSNHNETMPKQIVAMTERVMSATSTAQAAKMR